MNSLLDNLLWIEDLLPHDIQMIPKHGGQAYYLDGNLVLILVERPGQNYEHKGVTYPFDLWKGAIFPIQKIRQNAFIRKYLYLENHPANKDWLYVPLDSENFEDEVKPMLQEIAKRNVLIGIPMKFEKPVKEKGAGKAGAKKKTKVDKKKENAFLLSMANRKRN